ncbi:MAG: hypothetical protein ACYCOU_21825 [Sulfobacillus sp.]
MGADAQERAVKGPVIGHYYDRPIHEWIEGPECEPWKFVRTTGSGPFELAQLADDECVIFPGLIYQRERA